MHSHQVMMFLEKRRLGKVVIRIRLVLMLNMERNPLIKSLTLNRKRSKKMFLPIVFRMETHHRAVKPKTRIARLKTRIARPKTRIARPKTRIARPKTLTPKALPPQP